MNARADVQPDLVVLAVDGARRELTVAQFFELPLSRRIQCVIERTVSFYARGREVDRHEALAAIRAQRAAG
jgi:hypothetical protein